MRRFWFVVCFLFISIPALARRWLPASEPILTAYVNTSTGNDTTGNGSSGAPWATIEHARDALGSQGFRVVIQITGTETITRQITFDANHSGSDLRQITYTCAAGPGTCGVDAGQVLSGWTVYSGSIYQVNIGRTVNTIYENEIRAQQARTPNSVYDPIFATVRRPYFNMVGNSDEDFGHATYNPSDYDPTAWNLTDVRWVIHTPGDHDWYTEVLQATSINTTTHKITWVSPGSRFPAGGLSGPHGAIYYAQGDLSMLDTPGEFYSNSATGVLYYWPMNTPITSQTIVAPYIDEAFVFGGAHNITLDGLIIEHTDFGKSYQSGCNQTNTSCDPGDLTSHTYQTYAKERTLTAYRRGAVYIGGGSHDIHLTRVHLKNIGWSGVFLDSNANHDSVEDSWIEHIGAWGVIADGGFPGEGDNLFDNYFSDDYVSNVGELIAHAKGVEIVNSSRNTVSRSEFALSPRDCVYAAGDYTATAPTSAIYTYGNNFSHLRIHDCFQDGGDGGGGASLIGVNAGQSLPPYNKNSFDQNTSVGAYAELQMPDVDPPDCVLIDFSTDGQLFQNIQNNDCENSSFRDNNGAETQTFSNVSWSTFSASGMDYPNIGVNSAHPYFSSMKPTFFDGFENGLGNWTTALGSPSISTNQAHTGTHSLQFNVDGVAVYRVFPQRMYQLFTVWFYDDGSVTCSVLARADKIVFAGTIGNFTTWNNTTNQLSVGVDTTQSAGFYVKNIAGTNTTTAIARSIGWHQIQWDSRQGDATRVSIDGTNILINTNIREIDMIVAGDTIVDGTPGCGYVDDIQIQ